MKKNKNIEYFFREHIKTVSMKLGVEIEVVSWDVRYIQDMDEFRKEYLYYLEHDIALTMSNLKKKYQGLNSDMYRAIVTMKTFETGKNVHVYMALK